MKNKIIIPDEWLGEKIEGAMERVLSREKTDVRQEENVPSGIESSADYWVISGVNYRGKTCRVGLLKQLLDNGNTKTQDGWAAHYESARQNNQFYTPDYPLLYGIGKALYSQKDDAAHAREVEEARAFLKDSARAKWLMTLTRIVYQPTASDTIVHNYGTRDSYETQTDFVDRDEWITDTRTPDVYKALLQTNDSVQEINTVVQWLTGVPAYMYRLNNRPQSLDERVARFNANSDRANLNCNRNADNRNASLGITFPSRASSSMKTAMIWIPNTSGVLS
mgnify:CR=1 FL=1